ncbi:putative salivary secreted peptide [Nomia melanderi]|uniref:putative salivary secreted peptide n=1 Tax=Nomia melanderi TaxID=2448451 RepID=UPI0013041C5B|nr:probable salivary secreted peptide [Nomia melanderi]
MSAQKLVICLVIAVIAVITSEVNSTPALNPYASNSSNKSHNLIVGYRMPGDRLVLRQNIIKKSAWMQIVTEQKTFNVSKWERITLVNALDQKTNGNGAYASLLQGGPGYNNVTLRFKSQRGHGINFIVELYSRT